MIRELEITAKMIDTRRAAKQILGANYEAEVSVWRTMIRSMAGSLQCSVIAAVLTMANPNAGHGVSLTDGDMLRMIAALADLCESQEVA